MCWPDHSWNITAEGTLEEDLSCKEFFLLFKQDKIKLIFNLINITIRDIG